MNSLRNQFTTTTLVLIPVAIAINIAIGQTIIALGLPFYLDFIGTILVGLLVGPWAGALTGLLSNLIWGFTLNPTYAPFAAVAALIGILAGLAGEAGLANTWWKAILTGLVVGLIAAAASAPISAFVFGGVTSNAGNNALVAMYRSMFGAAILPASFAQGATTDPIDKAISFLIVWGIIAALPLRFRARFPQGQPAPVAKERP